ncbi:MAG: universal stress protein [Planctomycetes bacterium]|nr:universal stress protein [Planctomycetota bacterium]
MAEFKKIVLTTDLSQESWRALDVATSLASKCGAALTILSVVQDPAYFTMSELYGAGNAFADIDRIHAEAVKRAKELVGKHLESSGVKAEIRIISGINIPKMIVEEAEKIGADLLVLTTHGRSGLSHMLMGSTAERVVRTSSVPVLVVRSQSA